MHIHGSRVDLQEGALFVWDPWDLLADILDHWGCDAGQARFSVCHGAWDALS
jgi:hypothetical protein